MFTDYTKIIIKSGYEVEFLPGEEKNIQELKDETDILILGQHFVYGNDKELKILGKCDFSEADLLRYAEYIEKAVELGIPDIIAHPDIYLSKKRNFGKIEKEVATRICQLAEKYQIPLEINLNNIFQRTYNENRILNNFPLDEQRKKLVNVNYPRREFWELASNYNLKVLYGLDAHYRGQIQKWNELIILANEMIGEETINKLKFIENIHDANDEKYLKKIFLSGIETTLKATNDKELENRIKNFSNF